MIASPTGNIIIEVAVFEITLIKKQLHEPRIILTLLPVIRIIFRASLL